MDTQFPVTRVEGPIYQVTDGGAISRLLGIDPIQWQLIARNREEIPACIAAFEELIERFGAPRTRAAVNLDHATPMPRGTYPKKGEVTSTPPKGVSKHEHAKTAKKKTAKRAVKAGAKTAHGGPSLDDLGLLGAHQWRLTNAGVKTVAQLCGCTEEDLLAKKGVGKALVERVKKGLKKHKLRLASKVGKPPKK